MILLPVLSTYENRSRTEHSEDPWPPMATSQLCPGATAVLEQLTLTGTSTRRGENPPQKTEKQLESVAIDGQKIRFLCNKKFFLML